MPSNSSGQTAQPVHQEQSSSPWSEAVPFLKHGMQEANRIYMDPNTPSFYGGQTFADPSQSTLQGLAGMEGRAQHGSPTLNLAQNEANNSLAGNYLSAGNPYFSQMADTVKANVLPGIDSRFMAAGRAGSGLHGRAVGEGLGSALGGLAFQNYSDERNRMGSYAAMAPQMAAADYLDPQMLMAAGQQREQIAQQPISEAIARHQFNANLPHAKLADYMGALKGIPGGTSSAVGTQFVPQSNSTAQGIGTAMSAVAAFAPYAAMLFSDERLKENIERVGETDSGLPIYTYNYIWGGPTQMGVMAQDVLEEQPEAVGVMPLAGHPFYAVDYGALA